MVLPDAKTTVAATPLEMVLVLPGAMMNSCATPLVAAVKFKVALLLLDPKVTVPPDLPSPRFAPLAALALRPRLTVPLAISTPPVRLLLEVEAEMGFKLSTPPPVIL